MSLHCNLCGKDVFAEPQDYYMLYYDIWLELCQKNNLNPYWILCKACGEKALGRKFTKDDFQRMPMNYEHGHLREVEDEPQS
jgi:hypothetical protein